VLERFQYREILIRVGEWLGVDQSKLVGTRGSEVQILSPDHSKSPKFRRTFKELALYMILRQYRSSNQSAFAYIDSVVSVRLTATAFFSIQYLSIGISKSKAAISHNACCSISAATINGDRIF